MFLETELWAWEQILVTVTGISTRKKEKVFAIQVVSTFSCSVFEKNS